MDFIDKVSVAVAEVGKEVSKKAKDVADITNLNLQYKTASEDLEKLYAVLGKKYFKENYEKDEEEVGSAYYNSMKLIKVQADKVASLRDELITAKGAVKCNNCGRAVDKNSTYCPECGSKM